ncbi:MAG: ankyrin repeat domain-containing protein [Holosporales bacterium]|jgi:ankyrin repeat protein|nr:ankyrin repeat domain-containing protein [Holosporales bacterium]
MIKYFAALLLLLSACNRWPQEYDQWEQAIFCAGIIDRSGEKIDLQKLKEVLETNWRIGVIKSGSHGVLSVLHEACSSGQIDAVKLILKYKAKLNLNAGDFVGSCKGTALGCAVMSRHYDIAELLLKSGADPNGLCGHDNTTSAPLAFALCHNDRRMFDLLKRYGADIDAKDKDGHTEFLRNDSSEDLEKLIQAGADIHATDASGHSKFFELPSIHQVGSDEIEKIVKILKKSGLDINEIHDGHTPLSKLIDENEFEMAKILVRNGAKLPQNYEHRNYALRPIDPAQITDTELAGKTLAEIEHERYKLEYARKKYELKCAVELLIESYRANFKNDKIKQSHIKKIQEQEQNFENFITSYAEQNASLYLRSYPYHYYGTLTDMINLRIRHLVIHMFD